jgi:ribosomal protein S18 acetylase RimI-like enzyme
MDARNYSATETLRDGSIVEIRAQRPQDREGMRSALRRMSERSIVRRFFAPRRSFSQQEVATFIDIDFEQHVALVALMPVDGQLQIAGGARYIMTSPGTAEVAFAITDAFQHRGLGSLLMKHLIAIAREKGLREFVAEMLPENTAMLELLRKSGLELTTQREHGLIRGRAQLHSSTPSLAEHHD